MANSRLISALGILLLVLGFATGCEDCLSDGRYFAAINGEACKGDVKDLSSITLRKRIFVTANSYGAGLGGAVVADSICASAATAAGLGGMWVAFLSDSGSDASARLADVGPWYLPDQTTVAVTSYNDLLLGIGPVVPINVTEYGATGTSVTVWTGSTVAGLSMGDSCLNWNSVSIGDFGGVGDSSFDGSNSGWSTNGSATCDQSFHFYCLEL